MTDPDRVESATQHLIFSHSISERKTIVLSLVFGPRIDEKSLKIPPLKFGVIIDTPSASRRLDGEFARTWRGTFSPVAIAAWVELEVYRNNAWVTASEDSRAQLSSQGLFLA